MTDISLEIARSVILAGLFGVLLVGGRKYRLGGQRGWGVIVAGFGFLLFGSVLDITDNFAALNRFVVVGDTAVEALLEKLVGYLVGFVLLFFGFRLWLPTVAGLKPSLAAAARYKSLPIVIICGVGIVVSGLAFVFANRSHEAQVQRAFEEHSVHYTMLVGGSIERHLAVIASMTGFFNAVGTVTRNEFRTFAEGNLARNPAVQALEWIPRVPAANRAAYEGAARRDGYPAFRITERNGEGDLVPAAAREEYYPVYFMAPYEGNEAALGFDHASNPDRLDALRRARDSGRPVATKRVRLVQDTGDQYGVLIFSPLYSTTDIPATVAARRDKLTGFALGVFRVGEIFRTALHDKETEPFFDLYVFDDGAAPGDRFLHFVPSSRRGEAVAPLPEEALLRERVFAKSYTVADRQWSVVFRPLPGQIGGLSHVLPWGAGALGLILTLLLVRHLSFAANRTREVEQLVAERSNQLFATNRALEQEIAKRQRIQQHLTQTQKLEAIGHLTGGIAHDFNNLLMVIEGYARRAVQHLGDADAAGKSLEAVLAATDKAAKLTGQLLVFSRRQVMEKRVFFIAHAVNEIEGLVRHSVGEQFRLRFELGDGQACVETAPGELSQALLNLVINARDAMPNGGTIVIGCRVTNLDPERAAKHGNLTAGRYAEFYVKDDGHGIDEATLPYIFEPFFTTKEPGKGTGLGLATVYSFARQSGGTVGVSSSPGRGTTMQIYLPVVDREPHAIAEEVGQMHQGQGETILLVEDDDALRDLTRSTLEGLGYTVLTAGTGPEALEVDADHDGPIDLLLSDVAMPGMGGIELAEIMRATRPNMKIVFMSGYPNRGGINTEIPERAPFLRKPIKTRRLAEVIRSELDSIDLRLTG
ncbi:MAG: CHASE domain-containing protein [Kiloniellaceae bacterium]